MTEAQPNALQTVLDEFKTLSPEITSALVFKGNGQTIASVGAANEDQTKKLVLNFGGIAEQAQAIGGVENLTIQAADSQLNITAMNSLYLATVSSRGANQEIVKSLTQVVVPTVVRLIDQIGSVPPENQLLQAVTAEESSIQESVPTKEEPTIEPFSTNLTD
ncbi:MAG: hypothetical protein M1167_04920 [Chloroflexi bacterium]|nr:hypothetical protein [Chloroflexota bacterium]